MNSTDLLSLYTSLESQDIKIWIDGGWAVDALLGKQTRSHADLDIAIERKNIPALKNYLASLGYKDVERDENKMWDLVVNDGKGREIEVHAFDFDTNGKVAEQAYWDGYSADSLSGKGYVGGHEVRCVSLEQLLKTHNGDKRALKEKDHQDMTALRQKFGV